MSWLHEPEESDNAELDHMLRCEVAFGLKVECLWEHPSVACDDLTRRNIPP